MTKNNNLDSTPSPIYLKFPAGRGFAWLVAAFALIRAQTIRLLLISLIFQFFLSFAQVPMMMFLVVLCMPVLSAGILQSFYSVDTGNKPGLGLLFAGFLNGKSLSKLMLLGGIVMVTAFLLITLLMSGQAMNIDPELLSRIEQGDLDALQSIDPQIISNAMYAMVVGAAVSGTLTYFAVPLIWFGGERVGQSIIVGLKAMAVNWLPLLVTALLFGMMAAPIGVLFAVFFMYSVEGGAGSSILAFLILMLVPFFQLLVFGTQYAAFRDIFGLKADSPEDNQANGNQLVA